MSNDELTEVFNEITHLLIMKGVVELVALRAAEAAVQLLNKELA